MTPSRADLHIHTTYSDGLLEPEDAINYAVSQTNLRVIAITDHNTLDGARHAYDYWHCHRAEFGQIEVVIGEEISSTDGHILGLFLKETVPPHMSPAETVRAIHEQGGLAIAAHPFTHLLWFGDLKGIGRQIADLPLDGVEVRNSVPTEVYANGITAAFNALHRRHTPVGGSDCHYLPMLGRTFTWFDGSTAADLYTAIRTRAARPGGVVNSPALVARFIHDQMRRHKIPQLMPNDRNYRHAVHGLTIDVEELRHSAVVVLHCAGQLVRANNAMFKSTVAHLLDAGLCRLVVDLAQVTFVDSAGLGAMVAAQKRAQVLGGALTLCAPIRGVEMTLQLVCLDKVLGVYQTPPQAVAALHTVTERR